MAEEACMVAPVEAGVGAVDLGAVQRTAGLAGRLGHELDWEGLRKGHWFNQLVEVYLRHYEAHGLVHAAEARGAHPEAVDTVIRRACAEASLVGLGGAGLNTLASMEAAEFGPLGWLLAAPVIGLSVVGETVARTLLYLRMTCDLGSAFGVPFQAEDPSDVSLLYALSLHTARHEEDGEEMGQSLVHRLAHVEAEEVGQGLGSMLLGGSLARDTLPFLGMLTSSLGNWKNTRRLGRSVVRYVRFRRALRDAVRHLRRQDPHAVELLVEGAWFLFIADGRLTEDETAVLVHLMRQQDRPTRQRCMARLGVDDTAWLERLREVPESAREPLLHALEVVCAADGLLPPAEWQQLQRAAQALGRRRSFEGVESLAQRFHTQGIVSA